MTQRFGSFSAGLLTPIQCLKAILRAFAYSSIKGSWSASLKSQCRFILVHFLASILVFTNCTISYANVSPNTSAIVPDSSAIGNKVYMDNAANGVPVVNINDPNSVGVSHNKFLDYNVGTSGAIINNSQSNAVSELGGVVLGNSNLHNSATTIINEVTSTSRSTINGPQEILGGKADYILANPNGISINGGEFVNAHRATVTTGRVQLDSFGSLEKIYVEKGNIEFTDRDLDVSNLDYFDIIARTTELKVKIHGGRELRVITGRGEYDVKNDKFKSNETYSSAPSVAIDSSKLGGLYAGKIKLVSNEDGVGVNAPDIESSIGDIEITSSGKIVHRHVKSNANIRLKSKNDGIVVTSGSKSSAARNISYNVKEAITIEDGSILVTTENIDLNSSSGKLDNKGRIIASGHGNINIIGHSVSNQGIVAASHLGNIAIASVGSIDNSGKLASKGGLISLTYKDDFSNGGKLYSKSGIKLNEGLNFKAASSSKIQTDGDFFVNVKGDIENEGKILLSGSGQFTAGGKFSNRGTIDSADRLKLVSGLESTNKGLLKAANSIMLDSKDDGITNSGKMVSGDIDLRAKGDISNSDLIESSVLKIVSDDGKLTNTGSIKSATTATIRLAKDFINDGLLIANDKIKITSIGGKISSDTKSDIISKQETIELDAAGNIVNFGHIEAAKDIMLKSKDNVTNEGVLLSGGAIAIAATNGINNELTATIKANEKVRLQSVGAFDNKGRIVALGAEGLELRAYSISNQGNIETKLGNAVIASLSSIDNRGNIGAWGSKLAFTYKDDFNNSGTLYAKTGIELDEGRSFKGEADSIITTDSRIDITTSGDIENKGKITSTESSQFKADGKFSNSGNVDSGDRIEVTSGLGLTNSGLLKATNNILLNSTRDVVNSGVMFGENHSVKIHSVAGEIANTGNIVSWDINLRARGDISNSDLIHSATLQIISDNGSLINNNGSINAENTATITLKKDFVNIGGLILANNKIKITSSGGLISNDGSSNILSIQDAVELEAGGNIVNTGHIEVAKDITVKSGANAVNAGIILAGGAIEIAATNGIENIETAKINAATTIKFESESYSNLGDVDAKGGDISFEVAGDVINGGHLKAEKNLTSVGSIGGRIRNAGEMLAGAGLDLRSRLGFENGIDAQVEAGLLLTLKSDGHLTNKGSILSVADRVDLDFAQSIENAGEISSADHLKIVGGSGFTNLGSVISEALLEIEVNDDVENWLGGRLESADNMTIKSRIGNVANRGEIISDKLLKLEALGFVDNGGLLQGEDGIAVLSERSNITNDGSITTKGNATFVAEQDFINTKQIDSVGNIAINSGLRVANSGVLAAKSNVDIDNVADFVNRGTVSATNLAITSGGGLSNTALLLAGGISTLTAQGDVQNIDGGTIDSTGKLTITSHNGKVTNINSDPGTYDKSGIIAKAALLIKSALGIENTDNHIESDGKIEVETAGYFSNTGNIVAAEALELRVDGAVSNSGEVQSIGALSLRAVDGYSPAESMVNNGLISAQDVSDIKVRDNIENNRIIQAKNEVRLVSTGGTFTNKGPVLSILKDIKADIEGDIVNDGGTLESYDSVVLTSQEGSISNSGRIFSKNDKASLLAKKSIEHNAGIIFAPSDVAITSRQGAVTNRAIIESIAGDLSITADGLVSNYGLLKAAYGLKIDVDRGDFSNIDGKVLAGRVLEVTANKIENQSTELPFGFIQGDEVNITAKEGGIVNNGYIYSLGNGVIAAASGNIVNSKNIQFTGNGTIDAQAGTISSSGLIQSNALIRMMAAGKITNSGEIDTRDLELSSRTAIENDHYIKVRNKITFSNTPTITNSGLIEFGAMEAIAGIGNITNTVTTGKLKGSDLAIKTTNFYNNGLLELDGTLTLDVTNLTTNSLINKGTSNITIAGSFTNSNYLQLSGADLALTAHSITNNGKIKTRNFTGNATAGAFNNSGTIFGSNSVNVTAANGVSNNYGGYFISGGATNLRAIGGALTNSGGIYGVASVDASASSITNSGVMNSSGSVTATGYMTNSGTLAGQNVLAINGGLYNSGTMVSNATLVVNAGGSDITNTGSITSHGAANLYSSSLSNSNILQAVGVLTSNQSGSITNNNAIYGGTINLRANGGNITNNNRIIARDAMVLYASADVVNKQEISLVGAGTLSITAGRDILNNRGYNVTRIDQGHIHHYMPTRVWEETGPEVNKGNYHRQKLRTIITKKSNYADTLVSVDPIAPVIFSRGNISTSAGVNLNNSAGVIAASNNINVAGTSLTNQDVPVLAHTYHEPRERSVDRQKKKDWKGKTSWTQWGPSEAPLAKFFTEVPINTIPSMIQAGGAISGNLSGAVTNGSLGSGGGKAVANAPSAIGHAAAGNYAAGSAAPGDGASTIAAYSPRLSLVSAQNLASNQPIASSIADTAIVKRGPSLAEISQAQSLERRGITASSRLGKASLDTADLSKLAIDIASTYIPPIERAASREFVDQEIQSKRAMSVSGAYSPSSMQDISSWSFDDNEIMEALKGSDWHKSTSPGKYYIKETSPVFADMSTYFSTDNFIKRIDGFEPKKQSSAQVHYGDSMKQMDIVRRQMIELTGLGFLDERVDYTTEMRNLYESGIRYGKDMKLAPGIALSQEHVDQLQDDMVWAEEIELRGTKVIIPRLYLGKSKRDQKASGLLAREIDISAGSITNTSSIVGQKVRLKAKGDIVNSDGGDIYASKALELDSVGSIRNIGSSIGSGGSGVLKAVGNIENITTSEQIGDDRNYFTKVGKMAKINMVGPLTMISMGDLINRGSAISSGDLRFAVGGNFTNESVALSERTNASGKNYYHRTSSMAYKQGTINASGSVRGIVAGDFTLLGSRLNSGGDMSLSVGGNSYITSQVESQLVDSHSSHTTSGMFSDKKHVHSSQLLRETLSAASLTSGGKLSLDNEGDQVLVGAKLMGEKGLRLKGAKTSILASRLKEYSSEFRHDEGMWTNTTKSVGQSRGIHAHSELSSGGSGIEIESERVNIDMAAQAKPSWARHLEGRHGVVWNPLTDTNDSWHKSKTTMSAELTAVVGIAAGVATSWMGGWGMFAATPATTTVTTATAATAGNVLGAMGTAAGHSLMIGAASGGAVSVVNSGLNGRFAPDQMFAQLGKDLTSKESLKSLGLGALTAGIGAGVGERIGGALSEKWGIATKLTPGMDVGQRIGSLATQTVINSGVRTGLAGMSGEDIGHVWKGESLSSTLALGQSTIGDIGEKQKLAEGGFGKIAMHGTLGGLYSQAMGGSFASGAIGGGVGELVAKPIIESGGSSEIVKLVSTATMFGIGGSVGDIETSGKVGQSMVESNIFLHPKPTWEQEVLRQQQLEKAGEIATEYAKENPVEAAELAISFGLIGFTDGLAAPLVAPKVTSILAKQGVKAEVKRGVRNESTRVAQEKGMKAHNEFRNKIKAKKDKGWQDNPKIYDKERNKYLIPDAISPSGRPVELKPRTPTGIKKAIEQIKEYEKVLNKKGKVVYYDPN